MRTDALSSSWCLRRLAGRLHDQAAARALKPHIAAINPTVQIAAPLVFAYKGHQGAEESWHGAGEISTALTLRATTALTASEDRPSVLFVSAASLSGVFGAWRRPLGSGSWTTSLTPIFAAGDLWVRVS